MVCLGNICRSPLAQGILESKISQKNLNWEVDSSGTSAWHEGEQPDSRSIEIARENQIKISHQRARQFKLKDFEQFDLILAMDTENYNYLIQIAPNQYLQKVNMIMNFLYPGENQVVPDPYYNGGFQFVYDLLDKACDALIAEYITETKVP